MPSVPSVPWPRAAVTTPARATARPAASTTLGSNRGDEVPRAAEDAAIAAFTEESGIEVTPNVVDNETFQESINSYLQGNPDDVFTWFAGFRARFFDDQGFIGDISDVWEEIGDGFTEGFKDRLEQRGQADLRAGPQLPVGGLLPQEPVRGERLRRPGDQGRPDRPVRSRSRRDGLIPFALGDADGWPAMGTFDILNMRINGYDYHIA